MDELGNGLRRQLFGDHFTWGVSASALQTEGGWNEDGKGPSIWDEFSKRKGKILHNETPAVAADFYHRFEEDIAIAASLGIPTFRFSLSWPRILPQGTGAVNPHGIAFYNKVIDACLRHGIEPWITLYHWDLPQALQEKGGWVNRDVIGWFEEYVAICIRAFGDRVKNWMVLNEPMVFTGAGYFLGSHAPGKKWLRHFLPAVHHAVLCTAAGAKLIKQLQPVSQVGSTFSCSLVTPYSDSRNDVAAANRLDALFNRFFIEPALGLGYPVNDLPFLSRMERYMQPGDNERMKADLDFVGIQNYTREVVKHAFYVPYIRARLVPAHKRKVYRTSMNWEVYPEAIYEMIKKYNSYPGIKKLLITENGAAFPDKEVNGQFEDAERVHFLRDYLLQVLRAKQEGLRVDGYFVWSLTDNFEWAEGYHARFGLVHVDFETQKRTVKRSGHWYASFLADK